VGKWAAAATATSGGGQLAQAVFAENVVERLDQRREPVRGALIGFARK
jgi:hypothetical protein